MDVERAALAASLGDPNCLEDLVRGVRAAWFADATNRRIYETILEFVSQGRPVDATTIGATSGFIADRCSELGGMDINRSAISEYIGAMRRQYLLREITALGNELPHRAFVATDADALVSQVASQINQLGADRPGDTMVSAGMAADAGWARANQRPDAGSRICSGIADLDGILSGFQPGRLYLVGARPGQGKSGLIFGWAADIAAAGKTVVGYSLEMPTAEVTLRMACRSSGVSYHKAGAGHCNIDEMGQLKSAFDRIGKLPMWLDDRPGATLGDIVAQSRRLMRGTTPGAIIVDYLQLMGVSGKDDTRDQQIGTITRGLKNLSKTLGVPVIVASQLNREVEKRDNKRPQLSDLRESGSIEQDADAVMFLYREEYYKAGVNPGVAEVIVAKNRSGPTGTVKVRFDPQTISFHK